MAHTSFDAAHGHAASATGPSTGASLASSRYTAEPQIKSSDFPILNISHPSEAKGGKHRRQIRSHVTKQQHRSKRALNTAKSFRPYAGIETTPAKQKRKVTTPGTSTMILNFAKHSAEANPSKPLVSEEINDVQSSSAGSSHSAGASIEATKSEEASYFNAPADKHKRVSDSPTKQHPHQDERCSHIVSTSPAKHFSGLQESSPDTRNRERVDSLQAVARQSPPQPGRLSLGRHDPFDCYNVPWRPWYDGLLHYMMTVFAPRAWPALKITHEQGVEWETFMTRHAMQEPALFYVRLLFATGDLVRVGAVGRECSYSLQSQAIKAINEALDHPEHSVSDGLILAVGRIALHEFLYGDRAAANAVHRPAQRRMINARGGMAALDFSDLVKRLMRWADRIMSIQGNTERLLPDEEERDNEPYGVQESLSALDAWAPDTGQAVRKKIDGAASRGD